MSNQASAIQLVEAHNLDVSQEILPDDPMYAFSPERYFEFGRAALRSIQIALIASQRDSPGRILDFACAAGRVMRYLEAAFPDASLTACDLREEYVRFCSRAFGATPVVATEDPSETELDGPFDLIWSGSLLTHIDRDGWRGFLELFDSVLSPGGVVVFTTRGRYIAAQMRRGENLLNLTEGQAVKVLRDYDATGFGYEPTRFDGDCLSSPAWVCTQLDQVPSLELLLFMEHAWGPQDVVACTKSSQ